MKFCLVPRQAAKGRHENVRTKKKKKQHKGGQNVRYKKKKTRQLFFFFNFVWFSEEQARVWASLNEGETELRQVCEEGEVLNPFQMVMSIDTPLSSFSKIRWFPLVPQPA
jgi:hypothetical protein